MGDITIDDIVSLGNDVFVAGTDKTFIFNVLDSNGTVINITGATCSLLVSPHGQSNIVTANFTGTITDAVSGIFTIEIGDGDTNDWEGVYDIQPVIIDFDGKEYHPGMGNWTVLPFIQ